MSGILGAVTAVGKVLSDAMHLINPKTRDWVNKRKALEWGEKYILVNEELRGLEKQKVFTKKEKKKVEYLKKRLRYLKKWFFQYD